MKELSNLLGFRQSIKVVDANGNDVTPAKARMHKKVN